MAPVASTSKLPRGRPGKPKDTSSLLSNTRELPAQSEYVPPTQSLKKYVYSSSTLVQPGHLASKLLPSKKLAHRLAETHSSAKASAVKNYEHDDLLLERGRAGLMETEGEMERTWKVTQKEILEGSAVGTESKAFSLKLDQFGPYEMDYTRNGRSVVHHPRSSADGVQTSRHCRQEGSHRHLRLALWSTPHGAASQGDVSRDSVAARRELLCCRAEKVRLHLRQEWTGGAPAAEPRRGEQDGIPAVPLSARHCRTSSTHLPPMLTLRQGNAGYLKYQDTSTGQLVSEMRTKLGACSTMAVNPHNAFISLGHQNGASVLALSTC